MADYAQSQDALLGSLDFQIFSILSDTVDERHDWVMVFPGDLNASLITAFGVPG
jgi:hypothetical protein